MVGIIARAPHQARPSRFDVGWTDAGERLDYTVNVATAGNYTVLSVPVTLGAGRLFDTGGMNFRVATVGP